MEVPNGERKKSVHIVLPSPQPDGLRRQSQLSPPATTHRRKSLQFISESVKAAAEKFRQLKRTKDASSQQEASPRPHYHHHAGKKVPIKERIHPRYLEFEPLCCMSSCLVRTGCYSVVVFECVYVLLIEFMIALKIYDGGRIDIWDELDVNFNAIVTHQTSLYLLSLSGLAMLAMSGALLYGLLSFERAFVKAHWRFDFFALGFNVVAFMLYIFALNSEGPETWTWKNVLLVMAFASQIPLQLWAISVVKACYDFYVLLYVFVTLSEK